jgi:hypothetical protein
MVGKYSTEHEDRLQNNVGRLNIKNYDYDEMIRT